MATQSLSLESTILLRLNYRLLFPRTCELLPEYCHDERWFMSGISNIIESKFHIGRNLTFTFIDSWAKHPLNLDDLFQQEAFNREAEKLWKEATTSEEFFFKSVHDILVSDIDSF